MSKAQRQLLLQKNANIPTLTIYFLKDLTPQFGKWKHKEKVKESIVTPIPSSSKKSDKNTGPY